MRGDLADVRLADHVFAPHYAAAIPCSAVIAAPILASRQADGAILSEILPGEAFEMLELATDYAWGICTADGVVGFVARGALGYDDPAAPAPPVAGDPADLAETLIGAPAKPGGRSPAGFDGSGLVFYALTRTGHACPRFADLQAASVGSAVASDVPLSRGDLIFFADHAAIMADGEQAIHVTDSVVREPIEAVVTRYGPITARRHA
ncbi:C40 family peptidase [Sphingomonas sp. LB-2]|uniref:C40 family peptidase n=1 Tax=Sphingomonas caeni TaxID=2984949 RepID=UPI00222ED945|nr:C40 family peptidase [Sphingomonas caeni]MCW3848807.1 C40 family peptidase [Sphingomonas caeni]